MGNPHRGAVDWTVSGKVYTLRLSTNALCELESITQRTATEALGAFLAAGQQSQIDARLLRSILWAALSGAHTGLTLAHVGDLIDEAGVKASVEAVGRLVAATFPAPDEGASENPP